MARTVGDLKTVFQVLRGPDADDALTAPVTISDSSAAGATKIRIGILESDALGRVTPETQLAVRQAAQLLASQGFILEPFRLTKLERLLDLWWFFFGSVISELFAAEVRDHQQLLSPIFKDYLDA